MMQHPEAVAAFSALGHEHRHVWRSFLAQMRKSGLNCHLRRRQIALPHRIAFEPNVLWMAVEATERAGGGLNCFLDVWHCRSLQDLRQGRKLHAAR